MANNHFRTAVFAAAALLFSAFALLPSAEPPWRRDADDAIASARGKPLVLIFTAEWCGWCHRLTDELIADTNAQTALRAVQAVEVDIDGHPLIAGRLKISSLPTVVCIDAQGRIVAELAGYMAPAKLIPILQQLAKGEAMKPGLPAELWSTTAWESATEAALLAALGNGESEDRP